MGVDIVVVNWNGGPELLVAVRSALRFGGQPIVVDNASTDDVAVREAERMAGVAVVRRESNGGFAVGCNAGVAAGTGEVVMLLNPDAEITQGTAADLEAALAVPAVMMVGFRLEDAAGRSVPAIRPFPRALDLVSDLVRFAPAVNRLTRREPGRFTAHPAATGTGWIVGAGLALRRVDWERIGGMDEAFFLWYEDVDLGFRVARNGGSVAMADKVLIRHLGASTWSRMPRRRRQWLRVRGAWRVARRDLGWPAVMAVAAVALPALLIGVGLDIYYGVMRRP